MFRNGATNRHFGEPLDIPVFAIIGVESTPTSFGRALAGHSILNRQKGQFQRYRTLSECFVKKDLVAEYESHQKGSRDTAAKEDVTRFLTWAKLVLVSWPEKPEEYAQEHRDLLKLVFGYSRRYSP
jgi:hypothetical protein